MTHNSTDALNTFRRAAVLLTEPGGLTPVERCLGYLPERVYTLFDVDRPDIEIRDIVNKDIIPLAQRGAISSVVLDTGSELADRMVTAWLAKGMDNRQAYGKIQGDFLTITRRLINLTELGLWFICICHEIPPEVDEKTKQYLRGGPLMPGKKLPRSLPPKFDVVLRSVVKPLSLGKPPSRLYECDPLSPDYITKDRFGVAAKLQPMELAAIVFRILHPGMEPPPELLQKQLILTAPPEPSGGLGLRAAQPAAGEA